MLLVAIGAKIVTNGGDGVHYIILIYLSSSVCELSINYKIVEISYAKVLCKITGYCTD